MGGELSRATPIQSILTKCANLTSKLLEDGEREVVWGDLQESGEIGWRALYQILSLVSRRRLLTLKSCKSWLILPAFVIPASVLLSLVAVRTADKSAIYLWMWINNSDWTIVQSVGFWHLVLEFAPGILFSFLTLACCSWTCGVLIGITAPKSRWLNGLILLIFVTSVAAFRLPQNLGQILDLSLARDYFGNNAVFRVDFYRQVFPEMIKVFLVILPAWRGMRECIRIGYFHRNGRLFIVVLSTAAFASLVSQNLLWWQDRIWAVSPLHFPRLPSLAPLALLAPTAYLFLLILYRTGRRRAVQGEVLLSASYPTFSQPKDVQSRQ